MAGKLAMDIERSATPEDRLRALAAGHASVLERLAQMQVGTLERSRLLIHSSRL